MKTLLHVIYLCLAVNCNGLFAVSQPDTPPVKELKKLLSDNPRFSKQLNAALKNVKELPDGQVNPWLNKTPEQLFAFINEWYFFDIR